LLVTISICWNTSVKVWFSAIWSCSIDLFQQYVVCGDWGTENVTHQFKRHLRKCYGNWKSPGLLSFEKSYLYLLFFVQINKGNLMTSCTILIFRWINRMNRHNVEIWVTTQMPFHPVSRMQAMVRNHCCLHHCILFIKVTMLCET
jgi:hypothetical protein